MHKRNRVDKGEGLQTTRQLRVGEQVRHIAADIFQRGELRDPNLHDRPITVTEVRMSADLRNATIYVLPLGGRDAEVVMPALGRVGPYVRHLIAERAGLRYVPHVKFEWDTNFDRADRIEQLIRDLREAKSNAEETDAP